MEDLISTDEAAELLGVSARRVRQFLTDGRLQPARTLRGAVLLKKSDVEQLAKTPRQPGWPRGKLRKRDEMLVGGD